MSLLKKLPDKGGTTAWSPVEAHAEVLAVGTRLGAGVSFDDFGGELSFIDTSLSKSGQSDVVELGNIKTATRFYCMAWGGLPGPSGAGLLAGGMQNGVVNIWDPATVLSGMGWMLDG
jgi:protein transport protein SEC31